MRAITGWLTAGSLIRKKNRNKQRKKIYRRLTAIGLPWPVASQNRCQGQSPCEWLSELEAKAIGHSEPRRGSGMVWLLMASLGWLLAQSQGREITRVGRVPHRPFWYWRVHVTFPHQLVVFAHLWSLEPSLCDAIEQWWRRWIACRWSNLMYATDPVDTDQLSGFPV